ncbi:galactokinase [Virgibacillus dokdonensis]|uniref:Galactokinase n=1 Tax=Virgibacillus dokdonensis TaxID=302167 RepID=A0ABU7VID3_9BACI
MNDLRTTFKNTFNNVAESSICFAPGRINLIGEHTDYNGGYVLPAAISYGTYALGVKRTDQKFRFFSENFPESGIIACDLKDLSFQQADQWANYPKGMIQALKNSNYPIHTGADIMFYGNIPNQAGLSSSASIELVTGILLQQLFHFEADKLTFIQLGQQVENAYMGVNSGIMDQFAIGLGKQDHAILLNCKTNDFKYVPLHLQEYEIVIIHSNKQRTLADSKYNERFNECQEALTALQTVLPIQHLSDVSLQQFHAYKHVITSPTIQKRAKHVISENDRTLQASTELKNGNLSAFGELMNLSHQSLQEDYEVTGKELDTIVHTAWKQDGVLGARMTGAGFGGCAIAIVAQEKIDAFKANVNNTYRQTIGYDASFYTASIVNGANSLEIAPNK